MPGTLDKDEVQLAIIEFQRPTYVEMFASVNLDIETIKTVLDFADVDGDGSVEYEEFCMGIQTMDTQPKKRDTWEILSKVSHYLYNSTQCMCQYIDTHTPQEWQFDLNLSFADDEK